MSPSGAGGATTSSSPPSPWPATISAGLCPMSERAAARERAGAAEGQVLFLFVGRLEREKGVETLLEAWRRADARR